MKTENKQLREEISKLRERVAELERKPPFQPVPFPFAKPPDWPGWRGYDENWQVIIGTPV